VSGGFKNGPTNDQGDTPEGASPALVATDPAGALRYLEKDPDGNLKTSKSGIPNKTIIPVPVYLLDGSTQSLAVDGSVTPAVYSFVNGDSFNWYITELRVVLWDGAIKTLTSFGDLTGLTNGLLFEWDIDGVDYEIANPINNKELLASFRENYNDGNTGNNFAAEQAVVSLYLRFKEPVCLENGDEIRATVRDNLTGLDDLLVRVFKFRGAP